MVLFSLENSWGGELFVPKIPSYKILDVAKAIAPECKLKFIGIRPGEKIHEEMITSSDSLYTWDMGEYYAVLPATHSWNLDEFASNFDAKKVEAGFCYNSGENQEWETIQTLRKLIVEHVDPGFKV